MISTAAPINAFEDFRIDHLLLESSILRVTCCGRIEPGNHADAVFHAANGKQLGQMVAAWSVDSKECNALGSAANRYLDKKLKAAFALQCGKTGATS